MYDEENTGEKSAAVCQARDIKGIADICVLVKRYAEPVREGFCSRYAIICAAGGGRTEGEMRERWTREQAWEWYEKRPWVMGINYVPAITLHSTELWQEDLHETVMQSVREEFKLMERVGLNGVRMFLPFSVWYYDRERFLDRVENFLEALDARKITMMPVIFNDCLNFGRPENIMPEKPQGWQKYDIGHHGGAIANPFTGEKNLKGWCLWDEPEWHADLEAYLTALIQRFGKDERIYAWDLWNEPGNSNRYDMSIPYLKRVFELARSLDVTQPLTAGVWRYPEDYGVNPDADVDAIGRVALDESDIVTFHQYENIERVKRVVEQLKKEGRPMMNTEWLNRILGNHMKDNLPLYHDEKIGSYSWGLVAGKSQHFLPWDDLRPNKDLPLHLWQHDLFDTYHTPYDVSELELMEKLSPLKG